MTAALTLTPAPMSTPQDQPPTFGARFVKAWSDALSGDDGYGWIARVEESSRIGNVWRVVSSWGLDGFDYGDWPYVAIAHGFVQETEADRIAPYRIMERVEGDVTLWAFEDQAQRDAAADEMARRSWSRSPEDHGPTMAAILAVTPEGEALPSRFRGPFSWKRLELFRAAHDADECKGSPCACECKCHAFEGVAV